MGTRTQARSGPTWRDISASPRRNQGTRGPDAAGRRSGGRPSGAETQADTAITTPAPKTSGLTGTNRLSDSGSSCWWIGVVRSCSRRTVHQARGEATRTRATPGQRSASASRVRTAGSDQETARVKSATAANTIPPNRVHGRRARSATNSSASTTRWAPALTSAPTLASEPGVGSQRDRRGVPAGSPRRLPPPPGSTVGRERGEQRRPTASAVRATQRPRRQKHQSATATL